MTTSTGLGFTALFIAVGYLFVRDLVRMAREGELWSTFGQCLTARATAERAAGEAKRYESLAAQHRDEAKKAAMESKVYCAKTLDLHRCVVERTAAYSVPAAYTMGPVVSFDLPKIDAGGAK